MSDLLLLSARGEEGRRWREALSLFPVSDIYYTPEYALCMEAAGGGEAAAFLMTSEAGAVLHPVLIRPIGEAPWTSGPAASGPPNPSGGARDLVTPYGYGGPLCSVPPPRREVAETGAAGSLPWPDREAGPDDDPAGGAGRAARRREALLGEFDALYSRRCRDIGIVSEFVRFHPLLGTQEGWAGRMDCRRRGETVWVDLGSAARAGEPDAVGEALLAAMQPSARNKVRRARREGVIVGSETGEEAVRTLAALYGATVGSLGASEEYRFGEATFRALAALPEDGAEIVVARREGCALWAGIFLRSGPLLHYHLSGSAPGGKAPGVNNLALHEAALRGALRGARALHLGGGFGARADSLFSFKASIGDRRAEYWTGQRVHDRSRYERLCEARRRAAGGARDGDGDYFPAYRLAAASGERAVPAAGHHGED